jgi:hypothetical protein
MLASTLIARSLRLINAVGRGGTLSNEDETAGFDVLQEILDSESVSKMFQTGIRRHFFATVASEHIYSYGEGGQFDSLDFDDPAPIRIEDAYIRVGSTIQNNELVVNDRFDDSSAWTQGVGWLIVNGTAEATAATGTLLQLLAGLTIGVTYRVKVSAEVFAGDVTLTIDTLTMVIDSTGDYDFTYTATTATPTITFTPNAVTFFTGTIDDASVRDIDSAERTELIGNGSDYQIDVIDQYHYNIRFSKGTGGRPYQLLYSRNFPLPEIRFDNASPGPSDILVMDVTINRISLSDPSQEIRMHPDARKWLRYAIAYEIAPEYGKELKPSSVRVMNEAWDRLVAGNTRINSLRMDQALRKRQSFDINRGDP